MNRAVSVEELRAALKADNDRWERQLLRRAAARNR